MPYSEDAKLTEYFDVVRERSGDELLVVTSVVDDPKYLRQPFIVSTQFKKQPTRKGGTRRHVQQPGRPRVAASSLRRCAAPAMAQTELAGSWAARNHEDGARARRRPVRRGLRRAAAQRRRAREGAELFGRSAARMIERQCGQWPPFYLVQGPVRHEDLERNRSGQRHDDRAGRSARGRTGADDDLDGRPSASVEERAARARRLHHRRVGGDDARRLHDAHQGRRASAATARRTATRRR